MESDREPTALVDEMLHPADSPGTGMMEGDEICHRSGIHAETCLTPWNITPSRSERLRSADAMLEAMSREASHVE